MASGDCPPCKKFKIKDESEDIFVSFHKEHLRTLKVALESLNSDLSCYGVGIAKIKHCNALSSKCFSSATCDCEHLRKRGNGHKTEPEGYVLRGIFNYGFKMLEAYVRSPECMPQRKGGRIALKKLLQFLSDLDSLEKILSQSRSGTNEAEWTAIVAHHLLSKLAVSSKYTLDNVSKDRINDLQCSCGCMEKLEGNYGDTSMGVPSYWHGRVDILMDVAVTIATEEPDSPGAENCSSLEMQTSSERMMACKEQIRAEAIVFSFLQSKDHPDLDNFLIPTIAMSKSHVAICMYDCENDIFLETPLFDLFVGNEFLNIETIIILWLVLNYRYCSSGVPEEIIELNYEADFFELIGEQLEKYIRNVTAPCSYHSVNSWLALKPLSLKRVKDKTDDINNIYHPS